MWIQEPYKKFNENYTKKHKNTNKTSSLKEEKKGEKGDHAPSAHAL